MPDVDVVITVEEKWRADVDRLAESLASKGLRIKDKLPRFRTITGTAESSAIEALQSIEGIEMVRPAATFKLPPMDEETPQ